MKFKETSKNTETNKKDIKTKSNKKPSSQRNIIDYMVRYGNVGVYVLKNGKKGVFRELSTYINDGENPTSWALKISHNDGWYIQFGINANADFTRNDLFLTELFAVFMEKFPEIEISGNRKMVLISNIDGKNNVELISNYIINMFKDVELDFTESVIHKEFTISQQGKKPFRVIGFFPETRQDEESNKKFKIIIEKLSAFRMSADDNKIFKRIRKKIKEESLNQKDKNALNNLMKDYMTSHERISIAMQYLQEDEDG